MRMSLRALAAAVLLCVAGPAVAQEAVPIKVGVLKFGTVNWELDVVQHHRLDRAEGIAVEMLPLASNQATTVALQADAVDMIVSDWVWVSRRRADGEDFTFVPYLSSLGAVVVPADSPIQSLADLKGRRLGIAGGPLDKSWLLMRAFTVKQHGFDLDAEVEKVFGAPPLLNQQVLAGRVDAVINFWHYVARLEAAGLRRVIGVRDAARELGVEVDVPLIGYVFRQSWADANEAAVLGFVRAVRKAKQILRDSDAEWDRIAPLMRASDPATFAALRDGYRAGIPERWGAAERRAAARMFDILYKYGGARLVGSGTRVADGTFWPKLEF
jgi:NitT/TauT family transport system substrate-binding protein